MAADDVDAAFALRCERMTAYRERTLPILRRGVFVAILFSKGPQPCCDGCTRMDRHQFEGDIPEFPFSWCTAPRACTCSWRGLTRAARKRAEG